MNTVKGEYKPATVPIIRCDLTLGMISDNLNRTLTIAGAGKMR
jgi:hypothetical protein